MQALNGLVSPSESYGVLLYSTFAQHFTLHSLCVNTTGCASCLTALGAGLYVVSQFVYQLSLWGKASKHSIIW